MSDQDKLISVDDERLEHAQSVRHDIVNTLITDTQGQRVIPHDEKMLQVIRGVLKDSDSAIFTKRRLTVEETSAATDRMAAEAISKMFEKNQPARQFIGGGSGPRGIGKELPTYELDSNIAEPLGKPVDLDQIQKLGRATFKGEVEDPVEAQEARTKG